MAAALIDTNVILDFIDNRAAFNETAAGVFAACLNRRCRGFVAAHSITNMFYILRRDYPAAERRSMLTDLGRFVEVVAIDGPTIARALANDAFADFEDCLQAECALSCGAEYIVTRNVDDFAASPVPAVTPEDFLARLRP